VASLPDQFGKYHVLGQLAQGGMAEVYRVKTVGIAGFEKFLALKRIRPDYAKEPRFIRSFIDEARIAASLNHRNIVQVFDFGRAAGELYLAMELIEGVDLKTAVRDAAEREVGLPIALTCYVLGEIAGCLDYAHRKRDIQRRPLRIVHCDVSPHNVMLSYEGFVKILDFGVARAQFSVTPKQRRIRGKPRYMAPEQARFETPTAATDVFALATVAWELLTGLPLFEGATVKEVLASVRRADVPAVHKLNPDVPRGLSEALVVALAAEPDARGTAAQLAAAFAQARREIDPASGPRTLAAWLEVLYPDAYEILEPTTQRHATDSEPTQYELPSLLGTGRLDWAEDEAATQVEAMALEAPALVALVDKRRCVAVAARLECASADTRLELHHGICELAYKHGAVVYDQRGDGIVAVFGLEVAGEDDVAQAMGFCLDAVELVREAPEGGRSTVRLAARAGIQAQRRSEGGYQLIGDAVEEALSLARDAEPERPLLAGGAGRLASAHYAFRELPARKPRSRRLRVLELLGPRSFDERDRALRDRRGLFVGREPELRAMMEAAELAGAENRRVVLALTGDAGVGKSRLIAEFVARSPGYDPADQRLVAVAARAGSRDAPYSLVIALVQAALNLPPGRGENARARLLHRLRYVLEQAAFERDHIDDVIGAFEEATELRDGVASRGRDAPGAGDLRDRVASAIHSFRRAVIPGEELQITVLEDVHFADGASAGVLRSVLGHPAEGAELVIVSARRRTAGGGLPDSIDRVIEVPELTTGERTQLIRDRLGERDDPEAVNAVARRAGGNPLFIEELAVAVRESGAEHIPNSAREVILARVDRLPAEAKSALQHAAVAGTTFRTRLLEELLGARVHRELETLCEEGLLRRADRASLQAQEGELTFTHDLIQEVVYEALSARARRETHARLGHLLASRYRAGREEPPAAIARHFGEGGEPSSAATYWLRAGHVALAAYDAAAARAAFERTLELDQASPEVDAGVRRNRRREALSGLERAHSQRGDHDAQRQALEELEALAAGSPRRLADVKNRAAVRLLRLGEYDDAVAATHEAERAAREGGDEHSRAEALRVRGEAYERLCQFDRALDAVTRALDVFEKIDAPDQVTRAMIGVGRIHLFASRYEAAREAYEPALERVRESGDPWLERSVRNNVAVIELCLGDYAAAMEYARRSLEICREHGDLAREGDNLAVCGTILMFVGQLDDARAHLHEALAIHDRTGSRWSRADGLVYAGLTEMHLGNLDAAIAQLDEACALAKELGVPYVEANGQVARATALVRRAAGDDVTNAQAAARRAVQLSKAATLVGTEIEGQSRLANALHAADEFSAALAASTEAIELLTTQKFIEGAEQDVLYTHYRLLLECGDATAPQHLERARHELDRKLQKLHDPRWRQSFLAFPLHKAILSGTRSP
jgi:tetratricopeptide (TPR) repeat protein/tRNA A-37 threonylcarbamoyl transferase component Bud32